MIANLALQFHGLVFPRGGAVPRCRFGANRPCYARPGLHLLQANLPPGYPAPPGPPPEEMNP